MIHVSITTLDCTLVVPKHFTFTFMGSLQPFLLNQSKGKYWSAKSSIFGHS